TFRLEIGPEFGGDRLAILGQVLVEVGGDGEARNDGGNEIVAEGEGERRTDQRDTVAGAYGFEASHLPDDGVRRRLVVEGRVRGSGPQGQDAGVERRTIHDDHALASAARKEGVDHLMV